VATRRLRRSAPASRHRGFDVRFLLLTAVIAFFAGEVGAQSVRPISLDDAERQAADNVAAVHAAQAGAAAADAKVASVRSAFYPTLSASGSVLVWNDSQVINFLNSSSTTSSSSSSTSLDCTLFTAPDNVLCYALVGIVSGFSTPITVRDQVTSSATLRVTEPLTGLFTAARQTDAARAVARAAGASLLAAVNDARFQAADAWYLSVEAERQQEIAKALVRSLEARAKAAQVAVDAGASTRNDVLLVQLALAQARQGVIQAALLTEMANARLGFAVGNASSPIAPAPAEDADLRMAPLTEDALAFTAMSNRPELVALREQLAGALSSVEAMKIGRYPQLSAMGAYTHTTGQPFMSEPDSGYVGANVDWTIWAWGRQSRAIEAARHQADQLEAQVQGAEEGVRLEVHNRMLALEAARATLDVTEVAIGQAEESLRITERRQQAGTATMTDLLDAEASLLKARTSQSNARFEGHRAEVALEKAVGSPIWNGQESR
jgi:outer membrane protein